MKRLLVMLLAMALVAASAVAVTAFLLLKNEKQRSVVLANKVELEVRPGESLRSVAARLQASGLIGSQKLFLLLAYSNGSDRRIKHGRHEFEGTVTLPRVFDELARTPKPILRVTIPEGLTLRETGALLEAAGALPAEGYVAVACSEELKRLVEAPAAAACAEGYLFPDTYDLVPGISPGEMVDLQVRRFHRVVDPLLATATAAEPSSLSSSPEDGGRLGPLLTLASIVEKETGQAVERPHIASVFYNRLRLGMPLQTDPTVIYGVIASGLPWNGNLTRAHLTTPTPWNTYMRKGLPPGPICNPGRESIEAVLRPDASKDLYFVARGDGFHEFSGSLDDHNRAVRRYQLH